MSKRFGRLSGAALLTLLVGLLVTSLALAAYTNDFESARVGASLSEVLSIPGATITTSAESRIVDIGQPPEMHYVSGHVAQIGTVTEGFIVFEFQEPIDYVSFTYAIAFPESMLYGQSRGGAQAPQVTVVGMLDGDVVYERQIAPAQPTGRGYAPATYGSVALEGIQALEGPVDFIGWYTFGLEFFLDDVRVDVAVDDSLNAWHRGRPVAVFAENGGYGVYGIDSNTADGALALEVTGAMIEAAGIPTDGPVVIAEGQNPYNFRPFTLYRLPGGEFQLNTTYWDGKPYIITWAADASGVEVVEW